MQQQNIDRESQERIYITQWRRGTISTCTIANEIFCKKTAIDKHLVSNIQREIQVLNKIKLIWLQGFTDIISYGNDYFIYQWIEGVHFQDAWKSKNYSKYHLATQLINQAGILDKHQILHDELYRPWTNVLVDLESNITIIDFDQWNIYNTTSKNLRHLMQRLHQEWIIPLEILPLSRNRSNKELKQHLMQSIKTLQ
jgi:predicted Ser/Thr protein kinase